MAIKACTLLLVLLQLGCVASFFVPRSSPVRARILQSTESDEAKPPPLPQPKTFAEAERYGLEMFQDENFEGSKAMFEKSIGLKGSGWDLTRIRTASSSPVGGSANQGGGFTRQEFASKEEIQCAKYNIACCQVKLGDKAGALATLEEVLASGFDEYDTMRKDSTLSTLGRDLESILAAAQKKNFDPLNKVMNFFQKKSAK